MTRQDVERLRKLVSQLGPQWHCDCEDGEDTNVWATTDDGEACDTFLIQRSGAWLILADPGPRRCFRTFGVFESVDTLAAGVSEIVGYQGGGPGAPGTPAQ